MIKRYIILTAIVFGIPLAMCKSSQDDEYEVVVDLSVILVPNKKKASKIIRKNAGSVKNPLDAVKIAFNAGQLWMSDSSLEEDMEHRLDVFLRSLPIPKDISYTHTCDLFIEDRKKGIHTPYAPIVSAFSCSPDEKTETRIRSYVLNAFQQSNLPEITELNSTLKRCLEEAIKFIFNTDNLYSFLEVDATAFKNIAKIAKKKRVAFVHNAPPSVEFDNFGNKPLVSLINDCLYRSYTQGCLATNPEFYSDIPLSKNALFITNYSKKGDLLKKNNVFNKILIYDHQKPNDIFEYID